MAEPKKTTRFLIKLGDGADPETFAFPCGALTRNVSLKNNLGEDVDLDCDNPLDLPATISRYLESQDTTVSMEGRVALDSWSMWRQWADSAGIKNVRIELDEPAAKGGGYWIVPCFLETFDPGAESKGTMTFSASMMGTGPRVWTDAAA